MSSVSPVLVKLSWKTKVLGEAGLFWLGQLLNIDLIKELDFFRLSEFNETLIKANLSWEVSRALIFHGYLKI